MQLGEEVSTSWSDEELLKALGQALRSRWAVPAELVDAGRNAFAWRNIGAEIATLTYDSSQVQGHAVATRAEGASIRALTFASTRMTIELEVASDALLGQIVPAVPASISVQRQADADALVTADVVTTDRIGCFLLAPVPDGVFRLRCQTREGLDVLTTWVAL